MDVYEFINTSFTESFRDIYETCNELYNTHLPVRKESSENIIKNLTRCEKIRLYSNEQLKKISVLYSQSVGILNENWNVCSRKFSKRDLGDQKGS